MHDYLEWKKATTKNAATPKHYGRWVRDFHAFTGKTDDFTIEDVISFKKHLQKKGYSPKNIQYGLTLVRDYLSYQIAIHGLKFPLKLFKIPQERSKSHYALTHEEYLQMVNSIPTYTSIPLQRKLMLALLWDTGMRAGELLSLTISDLQPRQALIHNEKNHRSRFISWSEETELLLQRYLKRRKKLQSKKDWLFVSFHYRPFKPLTTRQLERIVERLRKSVGITNDVRPHSFRHAFVHRQLERGKPITTIAQMLGHSSSMNVFNYAQLSSPEIRMAWGLK